MEMSLHGMKKENPEARFLDHLFLSSLVTHYVGISDPFVGVCGLFSLIIIHLFLLGLLCETMTLHLSITMPSIGL